MSLQNKLLFLTVYCYVLQAISCGETESSSSPRLLTGGPRFQPLSFGSRSPPGGLFKPNFLSNRSASFSGPSSDKTSSIEPSNQAPAPRPVSSLLRFNRSFSKSKNESNINPEPQTAAHPAEKNEVQASAQSAAPNEPQIVEETSKSEVSDPAAESSKKKSKKGKNAKSIHDLESSSQKTPNQFVSMQISVNDPLYIPDRETLKERAKDMIRSLIRNTDANRAVTHLVLNARDLLQNKVTSEIIKTHTRLIKNTLMNEEAKKIIEGMELDIAKAFTEEKAPEKTQYIFSKLLQYLANKELPKLYEERFKQLKSLIDSKQTQYALKTIKNGFVRFMKSKNCTDKIAKAFDKADLLLSLDFSISSLLRMRNAK